MIILSLRTDKPEAELGLYEDSKQLAYLTWEAHRQLAETIHLKIDELVKANNHSLQTLDGLVAFAGPGSFTGLRIGAAVANALSYSLRIPIVATTGDDWISLGLQRLAAGENQQIVIPEYGALPNITTPRK